MVRWLLLSAVSLWLTLSIAIPCRAQSEEIFQIGKKDNSFREFASNRTPGATVIYRVGQSATAKDWYAYQPGTFDYQIGRSNPEQDWTTMHPGAQGNLAKDPLPVPFQVEFELARSPRGTFILELDAIFRYIRPAAPWYVVDINGHIGRYQLSPRPAPELWWTFDPAFDQFVGYESLQMTLPAAYFRQGRNTLQVRCQGGFGIYYDALSLRNEPAASTFPVVSGAVIPTVFYKTRDSGLVELAQVRITSSQPLGRRIVSLEIGSTRIEKTIDQNEFGDVEVMVEAPAAEQTLPALLYLSGEKQPVFRGSFEPQRRWKVYALPMEQADFGYDEVPARTLDWENMYIDKALEIMKDFPSYSFTFDASANLESYLDTRDEAHRKQLLAYLRNGKWGINAFYENFYTGLATPEELIHMLEYSALAGRKHGFNVDSASQTDEPSVTGAFPQILAEAGVKYYAEGSDPTRGPFNAIGLLNLHSPFYWEGPNGAKVLMWSAIHYIAVKDMTWEGWNLEAVQNGTYTPSVFGLEHSLPLFLSLYNRKDYPFDAVLLYGLHDDEDPLRHYGDADVIAIWNREYAYPKVIPAPQRDYFRYVSDHFGSQIQTYRGDGGAYWEDEAGADARIGAMNRTSQMSISAAEKLESVATWLQPLLHFNYAPFLDAWKNIMRADCYVWSDVASFSRPYSYRTRMGEATHRAWAETAQQQTFDLRLTAMNHIAEMIGTEDPGAVVFNAESWKRSGLFDFELDPDEVLNDPATGQQIPCGSLRFLNGYHEVRCWAADVPAIGYKYYAIKKGKVVAPDPVTLESPSTVVGSKFYDLQLDSKTGAVAHLIDKSTGEDLVRVNSVYGLNEYLYVTGGDEAGKANRLITAAPDLPLAELTIHRPGLVGKPVLRRYPWGTMVTVHAQGVNTPQITSTITLNDQQKLVFFDNQVEKTLTLKKEAVYFAFPFAVENPQVEYEGATAWVNPVTGMLPGAGREWFTTLGGVRVVGRNQDVSWVTVDAPLITLEDINRGVWPTSLEVRNGAVFSYAMNNYWFETAPAQQGGHFTFRYALTSGRNVPAADSAQLCLEQRSPLTVFRHVHKQWKQTLPMEGTGFLSSSPTGVAVLTVRPAVSEGAWLIRVHNTTGQEVTARLRFPHAQLADAWLGTVLGDRTGSLKWSVHEVSLPMARFDVKTVVVKMMLGQN
jgi:alpha-mannosidase